jgi:hypothetical protein
MEEFQAKTTMRNGPKYDDWESHGLLKNNECIPHILRFEKPLQFFESKILISNMKSPTTETYFIAHKTGDLSIRKMQISSNHHLHRLQSHHLHTQQLQICHLTI